MGRLRTLKQWYTSVTGVSADADGSAASRAEARKSTYYARPRQSILRRAQLQTNHPCGGKLWAPRQGGIKSVDHMATSVVEGAYNGNLRRKGTIKERLQQIISVTAQVVNSRQVEERYLVALGARRKSIASNCELVSCSW